MSNPQQPRHPVVQRKNDPYIYLYVMGEWYCYNPQEQPLGSGAMGDVYLGYRCNNGAQIAVKRVKDAYANNKMIRERARLEASLAFRHPNLVEMIGCCEYDPEYGPIFLLSHFVQGEEVDKFLAHINPSVKVEKICNIICSVLDALDYVHSRGVIHRDIKPSNIMIEKDSNVRLMDLGISRMNGGNKFSQYGFIGTPQYAAPEQIKRSEGDTTSINATTDIYETGITFYELLTGKNPMDSESEAETLARQINKPLPANDAIPRRLMNVIWKATEKDQSRRYQTALEFKEAIQAALQPVPSRWQRLTECVQRNINMVIVLAGVLVVVAFLILLLMV